MSLVVVTRPEGEADPLPARLSAAGYRVAAAPTVALAPAPSGGPLDKAVARLAPGDWIVVTSAAGARAVLASVARVRPDAAPAAWRWAAVGPATAAVLSAVGARVEVLPERADGRALAEALAADGRMIGAHVLVARSDLADSTLPATLRRAGALVQTVVAYRTLVGPASARRSLASALAEPDLAAVVFASGSAVRGALALTGDRQRRRLSGVPLVSIGPRTSAVMTQLGLEVAAEAGTPSVEGLVEAVRRVVPEPAAASQE